MTEEHLQSLYLKHLSDFYHIPKMDAPHDVVIKGSIVINGLSHEYKFKARVYYPIEEIESHLWANSQFVQKMPQPNGTQKRGKRKNTEEGKRSTHEE